MAKEVHPLHKAIADRLKSVFPLHNLVKDEACGGKQRIPLFYDRDKSRATEYCNVDMLVLKENRVRAITEIEESNVTPTQICGKLARAKQIRLVNTCIED